MGPSLGVVQALLGLVQLELQVDKFAFGLIEFQDLGLELFSGSDEFLGLFGVDSLEAVFGLFQLGDGLLHLLELFAVERIGFG